MIRELSLYLKFIYAQVVTRFTVLSVEALVVNLAGLRIYQVCGSGLLIDRFISKVFFFERLIRLCKIHLKLVFILLMI